MPLSRRQLFRLATVSGAGTILPQPAAAQSVSSRRIYRAGDDGRLHVDRRAMVSSGCAAAMTHATAACVAGGNPDLHVRMPNLEGFTKDGVIIPTHSRNVYAHNLPHGEEIARSGNSWEDVGMAPEVMDALLKLPESERVDLVLALWASLEEGSREAAFALTAEQAAEFDRRLAEHRADPSTAIPWEEVRKKFVSGR